MNVIVKGKNTVVSEALKDYVEKRLAKVTKQLRNVGEIVCLLKVEKLDHTAEISFSAGHILLRAEETTKDMYASIDLVVDKLERQVHKFKTRLMKKKYNAIAEPVEAVEAAEEDFAIIRNKHFKLEPMTAEEAILQMNMLNHDFFVYFDPDQNGVNVVYKRKDGRYGLICPEFK